MSWDEIINTCYDKQLSGFGNHVVKVIYADNKAERAIVLQKRDTLYCIALEKLYAYDDDELEYFDLPAYWDPYVTRMNSIFDTKERAIEEVMLTPPFKYKLRC